MMKLIPLAVTGGLLLFLTGCTTLQPITTANDVDLNRFMGKWYVVANIPTLIEKNAFNATETYSLNADGSIDTVFSFNKGSYEGPVATYNPRGFVRENSGNAVWDMQFIWPFKAEFRVLLLDSDYEFTIIGRSKRDYLWIMSRSPSVPEETLQGLVEFAVEQGYDRGKIQRVPHSEILELNKAG